MSAEPRPASDDHATRKPIRVWPLVALCAIEAGWLAWVWRGSDALPRQNQVLMTAGAALIGLALVLVWLIAFSRLRWKVRLGALALLVGSVGVSAAVVRFEGVTGDLVPIFSPRWRAAPVPAVSKNRPEPSDSALVQDARLPDPFPGFPQFLGPSRDGVIPGPPLARDWKVRPPQLLWRVAVGEGYSGFAIIGTSAISLEQLADKETVVCRNLFSGEILWRHEDQSRFENSVGGVGPRTTPTVADGRVFAMGATGRLRALDLTSGHLLWQRDIIADAGTTAPDWGVSGSPLVVNDLVIVHPGGPGHSVAAYHVASGDRAWAGGNSRAGYSSPQLVTLLGERQILIFNHEGVAAHAPTSGKELWSYPWTKAAQHVSDPRVVGSNRLVISSGYGAGADLIELAREATGGWTTSRVWHSRRLKSKFATLVIRDGFLYGLDDGRLTCLDLATGEPRWKGERVGHGQLLITGDLILVTAENGEVILLDATPEAARELGRFETLSGKMWNPPALAPPFLIVRTEREAACYMLP